MTFFTQWENVIKGLTIRERNPTPTMEQDNEVAAVAHEIYTAWMLDERFRDCTPPYFWAELAARKMKQMSRS